MTYLLYDLRAGKLAGEPHPRYPVVLPQIFPIYIIGGLWHPVCLMIFAMLPL
jgi:hypothetical protein